MAAMFPQLVPDPRLQRRAAGKQEPHVSTERTQPGGHSEPYLTTAHHQLLTR